MHWLTFEQLIKPIEPSVFLRNLYGQRPIFIEGEPKRFEDMLAWNTLNEILLQHRLEYPRVRLAKDRKVLEPHNYISTPQNASNPRFDIRMATDHLRNGATLIVDRVDEVAEPVMDACRLLERELCDFVWVNAYAGWHKTQGFDTHWDDHDVIIMQIAGHKNWRVMEPDRKHPLPEDKTLNLSPPGEIYWQGQLAPGDILYIPRGWWHDAVPLGEPTLHLTFGIRRSNGLELLRFALRDNELFRADLPRFTSLDDRENYLKAVNAELSKVMSAGLPLDNYFRDVDSKARPRMRPSFPWTADLQWKVIPKDAWLHWLLPRKIVFRAIDESVVFDAQGSSYKLDRAELPILVEIEAKSVVRFGDLAALFPDMDIHAFVLQMVSIGLLSIVTEH